MPASTRPDVHRPFLQRLAEKEDWAGLVCYWMALQNREALDRALELVTRRAGAGPTGGRLPAENEARRQILSSILRSLREGRLPPEIRSSTWTSFEWSEVEHGTLQLLSPFFYGSLCETARQEPPERQRELFVLGIFNAEMGYVLASRLKARAVTATFLSVMARGHYNLAELEEAGSRFAGLAPGMGLAHVAEALESLGLLERPSKLEVARVCYTRALELYSELDEEQPGVYQPTMAERFNNLGWVAQDLNDLEAARASFAKALHIYRLLSEGQPETYRRFLPATLKNLGSVQRVLEDLEAARSLFSEALPLYRELAADDPGYYRPQVAETLNHLFHLHYELHDPVAAGAFWAEALPIYRELGASGPEAGRSMAAQRLVGFGTVQQQIGNPEAATTSFTHALEIYRRLAARRPVEYQARLADTLHNLGNIYHQLNDLEAARASYSEALPIYRVLAPQTEQLRHYLSDTLQNLGFLHAAMGDPEAADPLLAEALTIRWELTQRRPDIYQPDLADTLRSAGVLQHSLNDMEAARALLAQAVALWRDPASHPSLHPSDLALSLLNLGTVEVALHNWKEAWALVSEALAIWRELTGLDPQLYLFHLGHALNTLGKIQASQRDLQAAHESHAQALTIFRELAARQPAYLADVARVLTGVGNDLHALQQLEAAQAAHSEAFAIISELAKLRPQVYRSFAAATLNNLGCVQRDAGQVMEACANFQHAGELYEQLARAHPSTDLAGHLMCWLNLGMVYLRRTAVHGGPDPHLARFAFRKARTVAEQIRGLFRDDAERRRVQCDALQVYDGLIEACVAIWNVDRDPAAIEEAVEVAEASRSRNLLELLSDETLRPAVTGALAEEHGILRRRLREAERRLREAEKQPGVVPALSLHLQPRSTGFGQTPAAALELELIHGLRHESARDRRLRHLRDELQSLRQQYEALLAAIRAEGDPEFNPDQPVPPVTFRDVLSLLPDDVPTAVVQFSLTLDQGLALIVTRADVQVATLPDLDEAKAWEQAFAWYSRYHQAGRGEWKDRDLKSADQEREWEEALPSLLEPVAKRAVRPVMEALSGRGIERLILVPNRALHVFPLHACTLDDGRYLADACEVCYTPSLSILHRCAGRNRQARGRLLLVENPTEDLLFAEVEGASLCRQYPEHSRLHAGEATRERILHQSGECHVLHYAGHAVFDLKDPLSSALVLGHSQHSEQWLTLRDIFRDLHLRENLLTVISGCESGMVQPDRVDEYVGLPSGFLYAGAACVLSTLWPISDLSTALLMHRFHQEWHDGKSIAAALRAAQHWLRCGITSGSDLVDRVLPEILESLDDDRLQDQCRRSAAYYAAHFPGSPPFSSPFHWAPFIATGLSYDLCRRCP